MAVPADVIAGEIIEADWGNTIRDWACLSEVDGHTFQGSPPVPGTSYTTVATVSLTIPADWSAWNCWAMATWRYSIAGGGTYSVRLSLDATAGNPLPSIGNPDGLMYHGVINDRRAGITTTGARSITLEMLKPGATTLGLDDITLYARATRTS